MSPSPSVVRRRLLPWLLMSLLLLGACSRSDPEQELLKTAQALQTAIEARNTGDVMALVDEHFRGGGGLDPTSTRRMLTGMFLRYQTIKVVALAPSVRIDPAAPTLGYIESPVVVTGAQGLIPERAEPYTVRTEWRLVAGDWKLSDLRWE
ncbi:MAG: hypothetical protein KF871_07155 [Hydrogenophaga sp.]|uniref:hypothetical protein n=1 Tax=Hydrogenophaga sp. TaxID=1904254 RepID=UPI001DACAA9E|nr:hypothetical protein [Hydrogenophaga sp.]MBX3609661.1 hypothetical protein [Hydrogenophaga sp.]